MIYSDGEVFLWRDIGLTEDEHAILERLAALEPHGYRFQLLALTPQHPDTRFTYGLCRAFEQPDEVHRALDSLLAPVTFDTVSFDADRKWSVRLAFNSTRTVVLTNRF